MKGRGMFPGCSRDAAGMLPGWSRRAQVCAGRARPAPSDLRSACRALFPLGERPAMGTRGALSPSAVSRCPPVEPGAAPRSSRLRRRAGCVTLGFYTSLVPGWKSLVPPSEGPGLPGEVRECPGVPGGARECPGVPGGAWPPPAAPATAVPAARSAARLARERNLTQRPGQAERRAKWKAKKGEEEKTFHYFTFLARSACVHRPRVLPPALPLRSPPPFTSVQLASLGTDPPANRGTASSTVGACEERRRQSRAALWDLSSKGLPPMGGIPAAGEALTRG